ncbi:MAG: exodeoxyribonuclease VII large subunit [Pseudomonadota bacterium]
MNGVNHPYHVSVNVIYPTSNTPAPSVLSVSQLNRLARSLLEENFPAVLVEGEISNLSVPASGHWYLTLKDQNAQVRCAMFRNRNMLLRMRPKDGMQVLVKARLSLYEGRGDYQLLLEHMEETGAGALRRNFEILKARLQHEGLFAPEKKKQIPALPLHIAVITSPTGAAILDIISVMKRRFPAAVITIIPVPVQGVTAAGEIIKALELVNARAGCLADVEVILLSRGGGSLEDLWSFNDEGLARAIFASLLPVVSAVGHDSDFTIADFVADIRAATPSAAAELLTQHQDEWRQLLQRQEMRLSTHIQARLQDLQKQLNTLRKQLTHPGRRLQEQAQRLDEMEMRSRRAIRVHLQTIKQNIALLNARLVNNSPRNKLQQKQQLLRHLQQRLGATIAGNLQRLRMQIREQSRALQTVSPLATLARGYTITTSEKGTVITSYEQVGPGATIRSRLANGEIVSKVLEIRPGNADREDV